MEKNHFKYRPCSSEALCVSARMLIIEQTFVTAYSNTLTFCLALFPHSFRQGDQPDYLPALGLLGNIHICVIQSSWSMVYTTPYLSKSPLHSALTGILNACHTGSKVFFTTSVLWQMVYLQDKKKVLTDDTLTSKVRLEAHFLH